MKMEFNHKSGIDLITGPMFSGKSTELVRRLVILGEAGFKVAYVNSTIDTRQKISHNKVFSNDGNLPFAKYKVDALYAIQADLMEYDVIGIDEGQFFTELFQFCVDMCERYEKKIIVGGLISDFRRQRFGQMSDLIHVCDTIVKLTSFCKLCAEAKQFVPALFSKRIDKNNAVDISVGAEEAYVPTCRKCFFML